MLTIKVSTVEMMRSEQTMTVRRGVDSGEGVCPVADDEGVMKTSLQASTERTPSR